MPVDPVRHEARAAEHGSLKMPVISAPKIPPRAWTPNTSSESSAPIIFFRPVQPQKQTTPTPQADHERARDADVAGSRRDRDEARDGARRGAEHRRLTLDQPLDERSRRGPRTRSRGTCS